jgi:hypothetical protein
MIRYIQSSRRDFLENFTLGKFGIAASGITAHQSALQYGKRLTNPYFDE